MPDTSPVSITVVCSQFAQGTRLRLTTWGIVAGRYASLGSVSIDHPTTYEADNVHEVARLVLTALYGFEYDL